MAAPDRFDEWAASVVMVGFQGQEVPDDLRRYVSEGPPAGIVVFRRNISGTEQVAGLLRDLRGLWPDGALTPLLAVDQEGGKVRRLRPPECPEFLDLPQARDVAAGDNPELTRSLGWICARQLAAVGFNMDFSPVLDVDSNPANPVIGPRSYGSSVETVITHALAFTAGLVEGGIVPCGKHFPGHGDTDLDSHFALPSLPHDLARLRRVELAPFAAAVAAGLPTMMSAHIVFEALDPEWPATLSPHVLPTLLRDELGFDGVVFSDDLEMKAIADHQSADTIARQGLAASLDVFLVCHELDRARSIRRALAESARRDEASAGHLERSAIRVARLRAESPDHAMTPWTGIPLRSEAVHALTQLRGSLA
jgi:beta-N-acetylhexosaminidase